MLKWFFKYHYTLYLHVGNGKMIPVGSHSSVRQCKRDLLHRPDDMLEHYYIKAERLVY